MKKDGMMKAMKKAPMKATPKKATPKAMKKATPKAMMKAMKKATPKAMKKAPMKARTYNDLMPAEVQRVEGSIWRRLGATFVEMAFEAACKHPKMNQRPIYVRKHEWVTLCRYACQQ